MNTLSRYLLPVVLFALLLILSGQANAAFSARIAEMDPAAGSELDAYDKLYMHIHYESDQQVRFKVVPLRKGFEVDYGVMTSSTMLWPEGQQEALAWLSFSTTSHIDEVRIIVLASDWSKVDQFSSSVEMFWNSTPVEQQREPAEWAQKLIRKNRLRQEFAFDPNPQKKELVYDSYFYASVILIPIYLVMQIQFLRLWRGRWRELAAVPIVSVTPLVFMALLGLGIEMRLWIIFIFRGMPLALFYLFALWFAKWMTERKVEP